MSLDLYTPLNPNQTATLVKIKPYRMVEAVQMADHDLLRSRTAVGIWNCCCVPVICTGVHRASVQTHHTGHAQGPQK